MPDLGRRHLAAWTLVPLVGCGGSGSANGGDIVAGLARSTGEISGEVQDSPIASSPVAQPDSGRDRVSDYPPPELARIYAMASWPLFSSFDEVVDRSDLFVIGVVDGVRPGRMVGDPALPFTNVDLAVIQAALGSIARGAVLTVEQTGGVYRPTHAASDARLPVAPLPSEAPAGMQPYPPPEISDDPVVLEVRDDPLLRVGERVALALVWKPDLALYQLVSPQGRFNIDPFDRVHPQRQDDPAVGGFDGVSVGELIARVKAITGN